MLLLEEGLDALADGLMQDHSNNRWEVDLPEVSDEVVVDDVPGAEKWALHKGQC